VKSEWLLITSRERKKKRKKIRKRKKEKKKKKKRRENEKKGRRGLNYLKRSGSAGTFCSKCSLDSISLFFTPLFLSFCCKI
jgi:hypothetical protein